MLFNNSAARLFFLILLAGAAGCVNPGNGEDGAEGAQGPVGPQGERGEDGDDCVAEDTEDGVVIRCGGEDGTEANLNDGAQGPVGPQGERGEDGEDGAEGPQGPAGVDGEDGAEGPQGPAGADGEDGAEGPQGPAGADGEDGEDGAQGPQGERGEDGNDGRDGQDGRDGEDGADGRDGADGSSCTVERGEDAEGNPGAWIRCEDGTSVFIRDGENGNNGQNGANGNDGDDGDDFVRVRREACEDGSESLLVWLDEDGNGELGNEEVILHHEPCAEEPEPECSEDDDCGNDQICQDGSCVAAPEPTCEDDADLCQDGEICIAGACVPNRCPDIACAAGDICDDGVCRPADCRENGCADGEVCGADGACVVNCPAGMDRQGDRCFPACRESELCFMSNPGVDGYVFNADRGDTMTAACTARGEDGLLREFLRQADSLPLLGRFFTEVAGLVGFIYGEEVEGDLELCLTNLRRIRANGEVRYQAGCDVEVGQRDACPDGREHVDGEFWMSYRGHWSRCEAQSDEDWFGSWRFRCEPVQGACTEHAHCQGGEFCSDDNRCTPIAGR